MNAVIDRTIAKRHLAVNLWTHLARIGKGYKWLADEMTSRSGEIVYVSRIQKILEQESSPEWAFVLNLAEVLDVTVEELAKKPTKQAEKAYADRFPRFHQIVA
jgi:hypothetical protein